MNASLVTATPHQKTSLKTKASASHRASQGSAAQALLNTLVSRAISAGISSKLAHYAAAQTLRGVDACTHAELTYMDRMRIKRYFEAVVHRKALFDSESQEFHNRAFIKSYLIRMRQAGWSDQKIYDTLISSYESYLTPGVYRELVEPLAAPIAA